MGGSKGGGAPKYNPKKDLKNATETYLKYLPQIQAAEQKFRSEIDPQRVESQQALQAKYGPTQYAQQLEALHTLDPQSAAIRGQLAKNVSSDLASGYNLTPGLQQQVTSQIRGAEAARGNILGNAAVGAEALYAGNAAQQLYQQHIQNAQGFLAGPTPEQQLLAVQGVQPDRTSAYTNPGAPAQMAQNAYQNYLAQYQASGGGSNQTTGGTILGLVGAGVAGYYTGFNPQAMQAGYQTSSGVGNAIFSDHRMKDHVEYVGQSPSGLPIYRFNYKGEDGRYEGTVAQHLMHLRRDAVTVDETGYMKVLYDKIDIDFKEVN